jgi:hypothetical protein
MVSFSSSFIFLISRIDISNSSLVLERISSIEEEPLRFISVFEVNI